MPEIVSNGFGRPIEFGTQPAFGLLEFRPHLDQFWVAIAQLLGHRQLFLRQLGDLLAQLLEQWVAEAIEASLTEALDSQKREVLSLNRKTVDYRALERQVVSDREIYQKLLGQTQTRGIVGTNPVRQVRLVEPAVLPKTPIGMDRRAALLLVALGGMLLAVSAPIGVEALDPRIKTPTELKAKLKMPCLAMVPRESSQKGKDPLLTSEPTAFHVVFDAD